MYICFIIKTAKLQILQKLWFFLSELCTDKLSKLVLNNHKNKFIKIKKG